MDLEALYTRNIGLWLERQLYLAELLDGARHIIDVRKGRMTVTLADGRVLTWSVQVLGTEADGSWMWSWANDALKLPKDVTAAAERMRELGTVHGEAWLTTGAFETGEGWGGEELAAIACGELDGHATFTWDYGTGSVYLMIDDPGFPRAARADSESTTQIGAVVENLWESYGLTGALPDERGAVVSYLERRGFEAEDDGETVVGRRGKDVLRVRFDDDSMQIGY